MGDILNALKGKKTYFIAALWGLATFAYAIRLIDEGTYALIQGVLLPSGLATLRAGVGAK